MKKFVVKFLSLDVVYYLAKKNECLLMMASICLIGLGLFWGLFIAPTDYQQGDSYRIMFIHVPCAILSLFTYLILGINSFIFLVWKFKINDLVNKSLLPLGILFTVITLITGSIWGKPTWGTYWIWDARLTSELILLFIYLGIFAIRLAFKSQKLESKVASYFTLIGLIDLPIIHYSVYWWNSIHQGATLSLISHKNIDLHMLWPLLMMLLGIFCYFVWALSIRIRIEIIRSKLNTNWMRVNKENL
ncbi:heme ABC transporter permease [Paraphotobacterium marinum]|uniref:Heme exporter protein C n=1 Tax=Paraphotobacterium marinum TaxID=1755811 RepID=A0A220VER5_9GAMM|nr:heme ABC transporter permease CcmC [Paraphotobacterium marinum]ASK78770.1 heme ABC transporter permease [Paraphotobacterium marinum]